MVCALEHGSGFDECKFSLACPAAMVKFVDGSISPLKVAGAVNTRYLFWHLGWGCITCRAVGSTWEIHLIGCYDFVSERWGTSLPVPIFTLLLNIWIKAEGRNAIIPWTTNLTRACLMHSTDQEHGTYLSLHEPPAGSSGLAYQITGTWESSIWVLTVLTISLKQDWQIITWDCRTD